MLRWSSLSDIKFLSCPEPNLLHSPPWPVARGSIIAEKFSHHWFKKLREKKIKVFVVITGILWVSVVYFLLLFIRQTPTRDDKWKRILMANSPSLPVCQWKLLHFLLHFLLDFFRWVGVLVRVVLQGFFFERLFDGCTGCCETVLKKSDKDYNWIFQEVEKYEVCIL